MIRSCIVKLALTFTLTAYTLTPLGAFSSVHAQSSADANLEELKREQIDKIERFLQNPVPGMDVSYRDVFNTLIAEGHQVFIKGGIIRDFVADPEAEPNDVDFAYTCPKEELVSILAQNNWQFTLLPDYPVIIIGDRTGVSLEGLPKSLAIPSSEKQLEFSVNNIFYSVNEKSFIMDHDQGFRDLLDRRIRVLVSDWDKWLAGDSRHIYNKIFRFWKMVGKRYIFSTELEKFIREKTLAAQAKDKEFFHEELFFHLSSHFYAFDEISRGVRVVMGEEWYQTHVASIKDAVEAEYYFWEREYDRYTYFTPEL